MGSPYTFTKKHVFFWQTHLGQLAIFLVRNRSTAPATLRFLKVESWHQICKASCQQAPAALRGRNGWPFGKDRIIQWIPESGISMHTGLELGLAILKQHQHLLPTIWRVVQSFLSKTNKTVLKFFSETKFKVHSFTVPMYNIHTNISLSRWLWCFPVGAFGQGTDKGTSCHLVPLKGLQHVNSCLEGFFLFGPNSLVASPV